MKRAVSRVRRPVKREGADLNLLLTLLSFAASVSVTRLFLELTGYPQLGGGTLHIAHVLWGGLLLFIAALLPLILANRWVYRLGAVLGGVGVGLFIDEVGKFITQTNDYFFPAAAPIIYAFFLLTVLLYYRVRRPPLRSARAELYRALDGVEELLDHDLSGEEKAGLIRRLEFVRGQAKRPDLAAFAEQLLAFLQDESVQLAPEKDTAWDRWRQRWHRLEERYLTAYRSRAALIGALAALSLWSLYVTYSGLVPELAEARFLEALLAGRLSSEAEFAWFLGRLALQAGSGILMGASAVLLSVGNERLGAEAGYLGVLISLTMVNLLVFYFDQFSTIPKAAVEFALLVALARYRMRIGLNAEEEGVD